MLTTEVQAQYYLHSAGIRIGGSYGLTYKNFFNEKQAVEFLVGGREGGMHVTTTFQFNKPLNLSKNETFFLYYGGGGHIGFQDYAVKVLDTYTGFRYQNETFFSMGVDAIIGLEYRFLTAPITIGLDIKPYFTFIGFRYTKANFWDASLSVKYTF
jgi:hypothetical protein